MRVAWASLAGRQITLHLDYSPGAGCEHYKAVATAADAYNIMLAAQVPRAKICADDPPAHRHVSEAAWPG